MRGSNSRAQYAPSHPDRGTTALARVISTDHVDANGLAAYRTPRSDVVIEASGGDPDTFLLVRGPFRSYVRLLEVAPQGAGYQVRQTVRYRWSVPLWWVLFHFPIRRQLRRPRRGSPWWAPPDPLDATGGLVLGLMCSISVIAGYLGTVITQTMTFAADEFGASKGVQGSVFSLTRLGVVFTLALMTLADRRGRRSIATAGTIAAISFTALGAFAPDIWTLGVTQTFARGITTAVGAVIIVILAEELPAGTRAYGVSLVVLTAGLGAGMAVWALPLADLDERGWRLIYLIPLLALPFALNTQRRLPETRRFTAVADVARAQKPPRMNRGRFALLAITSFLLLVYRAPASQLQNDFLKDERGFSAARISLFTVITSTPIGLGVVAGGRLADRFGRRTIAAIGVVAGSLGTAFAFIAHGWPMWAWQLGGLIVGAISVPALGTFGPEMFGTRSRGRANGWLTFAGVSGSVTGLLAAGFLSDHIGLGKSLLLLSAGPLVVAFLLLLRFPETANLELEAINPEDRTDP